MFKLNYVITGIIKCETGLHIGGASNIDIGGSDNVIIRDPITELPYIPGSSLKGKLRSTYELSDKESVEYLINNRKSVSNTKKVSELFGSTANKNSEIKYPTRIIVRDAYPNEKTIELWNDSDDVYNGSELKYENNINRVTAKATPRNIERVPKDSEFNFEIILSVYEDNDYLKDLLQTMLLLEDDYLGGSGSRGFGKIKFRELKIETRTIDYYKNNVEASVKEASTLKELLEEE